MKKMLLIFILVAFPLLNFGQTLIFIGDSLTEGYSLEKSKAFPSLIETNLKSKYPNIKVINAGVSGSTSQSAVAQMKWYLKLNPDLIVLALGANDGLRGLSTDQMQKNLSEAISLATKNNTPIILAGMKMPPNYGLEYSKKFEQVFFNLSQLHKVELIPFLLEGVAAKPDLNLPDKIHPNEKGHKIMAQTVSPFIIKQLNSHTGKKEK